MKDNAKVSGNSTVCDSVHMTGSSQVCGDGMACGNVILMDNAKMGRHVCFGTRGFMEDEEDVDFSLVFLSGNQDLTAAKRDVMEEIIGGPTACAGARG